MTNLHDPRPSIVHIPGKIDLGGERTKVRQFTDIVKSAAEAALMLRVASEVGVRAESIDDPERAAVAHRDSAYDEIREAQSLHAGRQVYPEVWGRDARKAVEAGGVLIRLTIYGTQDLSDFWREVNAARAIDDKKLKNRDSE